MNKKMFISFFNSFLVIVTLFFCGIKVSADAPAPDFQDESVLTHEGSEVAYTKFNQSQNENYIFQSLYNNRIVEPDLDDDDDYDENVVYTISYDYGNAIAEKGTISSLYNCHAFALYFKGVKPSDEITISISNPSIYFTDGSLIEIDIDEVENGDIIAYYNSVLNLTHTGIVIDATITTLEDLEIKSKDGDGFILNHAPRACSYYNGDDSKIKFYRWNHIVSTVSSYDDTVHNYICSTCNKVTNDKHSILYTKTDSPNAHLKACTICSYSIADGHDYVQVGAKYRCFECGYVSSFKPITPVGRSISGLLFVCSYDASQTPRTYSEMITYLRINNYNDLLEEFNDFYNNLNK